MIYYPRLSRFPKVFRSMTGLRVSEFDQLLDDLAGPYGQAEQKRLSRPKRQRGLGGGGDLVALVPGARSLGLSVWGERFEHFAVYHAAVTVAGSGWARHAADAGPRAD